jgi:Ca2+-binding EF-hand superfamily protein
MAYSVTGMSQADLNYLQQSSQKLLERFDTDKNGLIDNNEMQAEPEFAYSSSRFEHKRDWTGDYVTVTTTHYDVYTSLNRKNAQIADKNGNGLDGDEMIELILQRADLNGNGKIDKGFFRHERIGSILSDMELVFLDYTRKDTSRTSHTYYEPKENNPRFPDSGLSSDSRPMPPSIDYRPTPPITK